MINLLKLVKKLKLTKKLLLIGWDAADWKIIHSLIDSGKMPSLNKMVNEGTSGNLATLDPPFSPILWTSISTGKYADKHGILGFTEPDPKGKGIRPVTSTSRKVKAIWNILMQEGYTCHTVGWWPSYPAEPLNGICLSEHYYKAVDTIDKPWPISKGIVHPQHMSDFFKNLRIHPQEITQAHLLPFVPNACKIDQEKDNSIKVLMKTIAECATIHSAATWILENQDWDFLAVYYDSIDHFSHRFMQYHPPKQNHISDEKFEIYNNVINAAYMFHDMMLERLIELAGSDTTIILISDHGFHSDHLRPKFLPDEPTAPAFQHRNYGIISLKGPAIKKDELIFGSSLLDITPTILSLFDLPVGEDMDGKPLINAFNQPINIKFIPSWEKVTGNCGMHSQDQIEDPYVTQEALKQLIDLGYIEAPPENVEKAINNTKREAQYALARVYTNTQRYKEAQIILEKLYESYPDQTRFAIMLGRCLIENNSLKQCKELIEKCKIYLNNEQNEKLKTNIKDLSDEEMANFQRQTNEIKLNLFKIELILADILLKENKPKDALLKYKNIEKLCPQQKHLFIKIGQSYIRLRQYKNAENAFIKAIEIDGDSHQAHHGLGISLLRQQRYEEAIEELLIAIGLIFFFPVAHYHLGEALMELSEYERAVEALKVSLNMVPNFTYARKLLIKIYDQHIFQHDKAEEQRQLIKEKSKESIVIVSGLPRSGTSLVMQMLEKGGMEIYTDNKRKPDENNPKGYYEHENVKNIIYNKTWIKDIGNKAVKIISHLLFHLPATYSYKIIFVQRDMDEIIFSQHKMLVSMGKARKGDYPGHLEISFRKNIYQIKEWFKDNPNIETLFLNYKDIINSPLHKANRICDFISLDLDVKKMVSTVDKKLYRNRTYL